MPTKAPSIRSCGCRVTSADPCIHMRLAERTRWRENDAKRPSSGQRGYDAEWQRLSKAYLAEPWNKLCACGAPATMVAHVHSIAKAPHLRLKRSNWMPSCNPCNLRQNIAEEGGFVANR